MNVPLLTNLFKILGKATNNLSPLNSLITTSLTFTTQKDVVANLTNNNINTLITTPINFRQTRKQPQKLYEYFTEMSSASDTGGATSLDEMDSLHSSIPHKFMKLERRKRFLPNRLNRTEFGRILFDILIKRESLVL